jgi:mono/diheme cytochrome c family protein
MNCPCKKVQGNGASPVKLFTSGFLSGIAALLLAVMGYLKLGLAEMRGDIGPPWWESRLMYSAVHASVRRHAPELSNPIAPTEENLVAGGKIFLNDCAGCHGIPGKSEDIGDTLYPPVPQLARVGTEYTEAQIYWVVKHGIRRTGMFANGRFINDKEIWSVAAFIKRIKELPPSVRSALEEKKHSPAN